MRRLLAVIAVISVTFTLGACSDTIDSTDGGTTSVESSTPANTEGEHGIDAPDSDAPDADWETRLDGAETPEHGQVDILDGTVFTTEGGRYFFDVPEGYTVETQIADDNIVDYWKNGEPEATYLIVNEVGQTVGTIGVNIITGSDSIPADYNEIIDVQPGVSFADRQVYSRVGLTSLCWGESDNPEEECQFAYWFDVVSGGESENPELPIEDGGSLWAMQEDPTDNAKGAVLFNLSVMGPSGNGFPFEEKDVMARSHDYAKAWAIVTSFGVNE